MATREKKEFMSMFWLMNFSRIKKLANLGNNQISRLHLLRNGLLEIKWLQILVLAWEMLGHASLGLINWVEFNNNKHMSKKYI